MPMVISFLTATKNFISPQLGKEVLFHFKKTFLGNFPGLKLSPTTEMEPLSIIFTQIKKLHQVTMKWNFENLFIYN
jgi:hypothetical protein